MHSSKSACCCLGSKRSICHTSCWKDYTHTEEHNEMSNNDSKAIEEQTSQQVAFECMRDNVKESIIQGAMLSGCHC